MFADVRSNDMIMISSRDLMSHMILVMVEEAGLVGVPQTSVHT